MTERKPTQEDIERTKIAHDQINRILPIINEGDHELAGFVLIQCLGAWLSAYPADQQAAAMAGVLASVEEAANDMRERETTLQ